jgi:hypothetical protein
VLVCLIACCAGVPDLPAVPVCLIARCDCLLLLFLSQPLLPATAACCCRRCLPLLLPPPPSFLLDHFFCFPFACDRFDREGTLTLSGFLSFRLLLSTPAVALSRSPSAFHFRFWAFLSYEVGMHRRMCVRSVHVPHCDIRVPIRRMMVAVIVADHRSSPIDADDGR